jgi:aubergine-like protein
MVGMTASYTECLTQFYSDVVLQDLHKGRFSKYEQDKLICSERQQILADFLQKAFVFYQKKNNGNRPELIVVYRDAVGGPGSEQFVIENEGPNSILQQSVRGFSKNYDPKFLHVLINKNTQTRLFEKVNGAVTNPGPGTLVDIGIVERDGGNANSVNTLFDFFMISNNNPTTATALPVSYKVIANTSGLTKREIEEFTYHQCYSYFGFGGPIKVPAALKYAEKKAQQSYNTKSSTRKEEFRAPNPKLNHQLHFL